MRARAKTLSKAAIRETLKMWHSHGGTVSLDYISTFGDLHPIALIPRALSGMPDAFSRPFQPMDRSDASVS